MSYKIVSYDQIPIFNEGLKKIFDQDNKFHLINAFCDFDDFLTFVLEHKPDFILISDNIPNKSFTDAIRYIHEQIPQTKIIAISEKKSEYQIFSAIKAGASAYLYKPNTTPDELFNALQAALSGEEYFNEPISNIIIQSYVKNAKKGDEISHRNPKNLTRREVQILQLICEGLTNKQIADGLFISVRTVDAHKNHIMQKLGLKSTAELVKFAIKHGYVKL